MIKRIIALIFIFVCTAVSWMILGGITMHRTETFDSRLKGAVSQLWGTQQQQKAPYVFYKTKEKREAQKWQNDKYVNVIEEYELEHPLTLESSDIKVDLSLEHRKKGLLWYSTYTVGFSGQFIARNTTDQPKKIFFTYSFPAADGIYDNFRVSIDNKEETELQPSGGQLTYEFQLQPDETRKVKISYNSQGLDRWWYIFGYNVSQIRNFNLSMTTDFKDIDFPENSISPTDKKETVNGWDLTWNYSNLISGIQIGMELPKKLNPGPFAAKISFFAPVSLFLFFFLMFVITTLHKVKVHPMNFFFLAASFFSFHLLMAYLVDHVEIHTAFAICSIVSIFLTVSYMRLVAGSRFAFLETGISQFVYLVLFSYAFFLEGYTGLSITVVCIITLFVVMQMTGRVNWEEHFAGKK